MNSNYLIEQGKIRKRSSRAKDNECHICQSTEELEICPTCNQKVCAKCTELAKNLVYELKINIRIKECVCIGCCDAYYIDELLG